MQTTSGKRYWGQSFHYITQRDTGTVTLTLANIFCLLGLLRPNDHTRLMFRIQSADFYITLPARCDALHGACATILQFDNDIVITSIYGTWFKVTKSCVCRDHYLYINGSVMMISDQYSMSLHCSRLRQLQWLI